MKKIILLSCILISMPLSVIAAIINVPGDQPTIQAGIDASVDGDIVLLSAGAYKWSGNYNIDFNGKSITVKSANGPDKCIIDCQSLGRGFLLFNGEEVTLEGITIMRGNAGDGNAGGGVYVYGSDVTIINCIFNENSSDYGGAVCAYSESTPVLSHCTFIDNTAATSGGAIYADSNSSSGITIDNCTFTGNNASAFGGAVSSFYSTFTDCTFENNNNTSFGGAIYTIGSHFTNCDFIDNNSSIGGAIHSSGCTFTDCSFTGNSASHFGGAACSQCVFCGCIFTSNSAGYYGGAVESNDSSSFTGCKFSNNSALTDGGALYSSGSNLTNCIFTRNNSSGSGGAVYYKRNLLSIVNCTFSRNGANVQGGAVWCDIPLTPENPVTLKNCILWENTATEISEIYEKNKSLIISYSNIKGGHDGVGNIDADPLFIDVNNDDLHLHDISPCIDAGTAEEVPTDDLDGNFRPTGIGYDMGAYEFNVNVIPIANAGPNQIIPGNCVDLNGSLSSDPDGNIVSWDWTLEHQVNSVYNRVVTGEMPTVSDLEYGNYCVTLTVTDNHGVFGKDEMYLCVAASDVIYTQADLDKAYDDGVAECPLRVDAEGNKFLDGPLIIENKGVLTIR